MKYKLGEFESKSKAGLQAEAKRILYANEVDSDVNGSDLEFMIKYSEKFHVDWKLKKGVGLRIIRRVKEPLYGKYRGFQVVRIDGTSTDISYIISNIQKKNYYREFTQAMRKIIEPQIIEFRDSSFTQNTTMICPINREIIDKTNSHVDHFEPSFDELVRDFIDKYEIKLDADLFPPERDNQVVYSITDEKIMSDFIEYHRNNANLRMLSINGNLQRRK